MDHENQQSIKNQSENNMDNSNENQQSKTIKINYPKNKYHNKFETFSNSHSPPQNPYYNENQSLSKSFPINHLMQTYDEKINQPVHFSNSTSNNIIKSLEFEKNNFELFYKNHQNRMSIDNSLINIKIISEIKACQKYIIQNGFVSLFLFIFSECAFFNSLIEDI